jgi:HK97 family phage major capsid protein
MQKNQIKTKSIDGHQYRHFAIDRSKVEEAARTIELSFSSEDPCDRWWGTEILDHGSGSVRLARLQATAPLLLDHNTRDQIGVLEKIWIGSDRKGRALARFGKSARAEEIWQDVLDGIRKSVSVGYIVHRAVLEEQNEQKETYRVMDWEPLEVSLVSVPADATVGVGRSADARDHQIIIEIPNSTKEIRAMEKEEKRELPEEAQKRIDEAAGVARRAEQNRIREIYAYVKAWPQVDLSAEADKAVAEGTKIEDFRAVVFDRLDKSKVVKPVETGGDLGMSDKEAKRFSMVRAIRALASRGTPDEGRLMQDAAFEFECSREFAKKVNREAKGFFVPPEVLKRDLTVGTDSAGGYLVQTTLLSGSFIELLRNRMVVKQAGATILTGLVGDIAIPKQTGAATAYWLSENGAPTESQQTFGQLALAPKTIGAYTDLSRKLLLQSSLDIENFVRGDLAKVLAMGIDLVCLHGTGVSPQPAGIAVTSGIGSVVGGTNGAAPDWADVVGLETEVATDNADVGALAYITNSKVRGKLKRVFTNATYGERPIWMGGQGFDGIGEVNGYRAFVSNQVSSTLTKGNQSASSAIFFGNWADLVIGFWSGIDILVDPYSMSTTGAVRVTAFQDLDVGVRHAESFSAMLDALTV